MTSRIIRISILTLLAPIVAASIWNVKATDKADEVAARAHELLNRRCFSCHGANGVAKKNVFVLDRGRLLADRVVVPGDASSLLLRMVESGAMPMDGSELSTAEKSTLREWILSGAPGWGEEIRARRFVDEGSVLQAIETDLIRQPDRSRQFLRYFSLAHLYNSGVPDSELEVYRSALGKLINSLSWHKEITTPIAVDPSRIIFRIDLRDYNWTSAAWDLVLAAYPYGLRSVQATNITNLSGAKIPYVRADWFARNASEPPLYHDLLSLPRSAADLERILGVDSARDLSEERNTVRGGIRASGVSQNNRVLERHASVYGAYWKSFDFRNSVDQQNIFQHPLNFNPAGSEIVFNLPNGLQAYLVVDGSGRRINEAPVAIVSDRTNPDEPVIRSGRSCMSCHYDGIREFRDETRASILARAASDTFDNGKALSLYAPQERIDQLIRRDRDRFRTAALLASGGEALSPQREPVNELARRFSSDLSLAQAASEAGLRTEDFRARLAGSPRLQQLGFSSLLVPNGGIKRPAWERGFDEMASEIGLGRPITAISQPPPLRQAIEGVAPASVGTNPESVMRSAHTISVSSMTMFLKPDQLEDELRKRPEFTTMGLLIVKDARQADIIIDLDRPVFTYTFTYSMSAADTRVVLSSGKVIAFDGNFAAPKIAKELIKRLKQARGIEDTKSSKK